MTRHHGGSAVPFLYEMNESSGLVSSDISQEKCDDVRERYQNADPFTHIVIDEFLPPIVLDTCLAEFPVGSDEAERPFDRKQERLKESFHPDLLPALSRGLFYSFNSRP